MNDPPHCLLSQHALDQATAMGVTANEVRAVIFDPVVDCPSEDPTCRIAHDGRLKVVYNPTEKIVVTVLWVAHDWQDDRYQEPEHNMSGWINLDAKDAEKLLRAWGFEIATEKETANLWTHPDDPEKRLIPFSASDRSTRQNGKGSYRQAAQVCGVNVPTWLKGPTETALKKMRRNRQLDELVATDALLDAPDPLGINTKVATDKYAKLSDEILYAAPPTIPATAEEPPVPSLTPTEEKVLAAVLDAVQPLTARELAESIGIHDVTARDSLRKLVKQNDVFVVGSQPRATPGRQPDLFWHSATAPAPAEIPQETPVIIPDTISELDEPADKPAKLFTETGTPWPTGGLLIQDEDGVFYVARKLVEEGR